MLKWFVLWSFLLPAVAAAQTDDEQLLAGADARIKQYRTAEVTLHLTDVEGNPLPPNTTVHIEQTRHAFLFGCNVFNLHGHWDPAVNAGYARHFKELFNYATLPFYWWNYQPVEGYERSRDIDQMIQWCRGNDIAPKGHPLAWNFHDPKWLPDDPATVARMQIERIARTIREYKNRIEIWDVVNEATEYRREFLLEQAPKLTAAIEQMGRGEYLRACFRAARQADPEALLIINDYSFIPEFENKVLKALIDDQGRPLFDAIGLQSHQHGGAMPLTDVWTVCERYAKFGKPLHWTENTFVSGEEGWDLNKRENFTWTSTPEGEQRQAELATRFYTLLFSHPAVEAITWWDFADYYSWMAAPSGLVDRDMNPKPAYRELHKLIKDKWWTKTQSKTEEGGRVTFCGFYGDYKITAEIDGQMATGTFKLSKGKGKSINIELKPSEDK